MKKYKCIKDLQSDDFGFQVGQSRTAQGWKNWALEDRAYADDEENYEDIEKTPLKDIIAFISGLYGLEIVEDETTF